MDKIINNIIWKDNWRTKIYDQNIIDKWRIELNGKIEETVFDNAIFMLKSMAQNKTDSSDRVREKVNAILNNQNVIDSWKKQTKHRNVKNFDALIEEIKKTNYAKFNQVQHASPISNLYDHVKVIDNLIPSKLKQDFRTQLLALNNQAYYHLGSNDQVIDYVHPSMYCYVKGISKFNDGRIDDSLINYLNNDKYQWLPCEVKVKDDKSIIKSYINNLDEKHQDIYLSIQSIFHLFVPHFEDLLGLKLKGNVQVIVKIAKYVLTKDKPIYSASNWHIEGMPYENIIATGIFYYHTRNIVDDALEFRRPLAEPIDYAQDDHIYVKNEYDLEDGDKLNEYLGYVNTIKNRCIVFPNYLQHKVTEFKLKLDADHGSRGILVFFLVNPSTKIISTSDIPPQQSIMSKSDALNHMKGLMTDRKFFVDHLNKEIFEREFSLCEH